MKSQSSGNDVLVVSRQDLVVPIKRSHRLLLAQLYTSLLIVPIVAVLVYLMAYYAPDALVLSDLSPMSWLWIVLGIAGVIWFIKKCYTFIRSSKHSLTEIDQATTAIQLTTGLTAYVKQLSKYWHVPSLLFGKKMPVTLHEGLKHLENEMNKGLIRSMLEFTVLGMVLIGVVNYIQLASPKALDQLPLYMVMGSLIAVFIIRFGMSLKSRPLVKQWIHVVQDLSI